MCILFFAFVQVAIAPSLDTLMLDEPYEASQRKQAMFNPPEDQELGVKKKLPSVKSQEFNGRNVSLPIKTVNRSPQVSGTVICMYTLRLI